MKINKTLLALLLGSTGLLTGCATTPKEPQKVETPPIDTIIDYDLETTVCSSRFIPNGNYKVTFKSNDMADQLLYLKGDAHTYQAIGVTGKGYYREIFTLHDEKLKLVRREDLEDVPMEKILEKDCNVNVKESDYKTILGNIVNEGDTWDNLKIEEVGLNLKLSNLQLEGSYLKLVETVKDGDNPHTVETYFSEGLGIVKYEVIEDGTVIEYSELQSYEKVK